MQSNRISPYRSARPPCLPALWVILGGGLAALVATYWDDSWHTDRGRDSFAIPPHLLLYGGIVVCGLAIVAWIAYALVAVREPWDAHGLQTRWQQLCANPPLLLALVGVVATMASAPIDNAWHLAFGRDAVLWSPPHLLGVAGMLTIGSSALLASRDLRQPWRWWIAVGTATLVLGASLIPVMEYESDVPQFATFWYLPVMTTGSALAFAMIRVALPIRWGATIVAAVYTGLRIGIVAMLMLLGFSQPLIPLIIVPAFVLDLMTAWRLPPVVRAVAFASVTYLVYVPYLDFIVQGIHIDMGAVTLGLLLAIIGSYLVMRPLTVTEAIEANGPRNRSPLRPALSALLLATLLTGLSTGHALAHDPGQGEEIGRAQLVATLNQHTVSVTGELDALAPGQPCRDIAPRGLVARRAGQVLTAPLSRDAGCRFTGRLSLPDAGRWFVYLEFTHADQRIETWLPVIVSNENTRFAKQSSLYIAVASSGSSAERVSSILLYLVDMTLLVAIIVVFARSRQRARRSAETLS